MLEILIRIGSYLFIIALGFFLKSIGKFSKADAGRLGILIVTVTLPAALIRNAGSIIISPELPLLFACGILANVITLSAGFLLARRRREPLTAAMMLTTSSYNVGGYLLPFVEMFYPGTGVAYLCMFDMGNAVMGLGVSYAFAKVAADPQEKFTLKAMAGTLLSSVPFMSYVLLFALALFHLHLPATVMTFANVIADANGFVTMFMLGLLIDFHIPKAETRRIFKVTGARIGLNLAMMVCIALLPVDNPLMKLVAALCLATPVAAASVVYSMECGYKGDLTGMVSTTTILLSVVQILGLILLFGQTLIAG